MKVTLCSKEELQSILRGNVDNLIVPYKAHIAMAAELQEYRRMFGPLGCSWLEIPVTTELHDHEME